MKRCKGICAACFVLFLMGCVGCGKVSETAEVSPAQVTQEETTEDSHAHGTEKEEPKKEIPILKRDPTPREIVQAMEESSDFAYGWFWDNVHVDHNDTICDGIWRCERVIEAGVNTKEDVLELTRGYFTEDVAQRLLDSKVWVEKEGCLYVSETDGLSSGGGNTMEVTVQKDSDVQYTITIRELINWEASSGISDPYSVHYQYVNGRWLFDNVVLVCGMPVRLLEAATIS